jgi:tetratricopeptide (TPR) repeat protein
MRGARASAEGRRRSAVAGVIVGAILLACRAEEGEPPGRPASPLRAPDRALLAVPLPAMRTVEEAGRPVILEHERRLAASLAEGAASPVERAAAYGDLAKAYYAFGLYDHAVPCLENAARLEPGSFAWPYLLGRTRWQRGEADAARASLERALEIRPHSLPALFFLAEVHRAGGRLDDARGAYGRALAADPRSAAAHYGLGQLAFLQGDSHRAIDHFEEALERQPRGMGRVHYQLAVAYRQVGHAEKARLHLEQRGEGAPAPGTDILMQEIADLRPRSAARRGAVALRAGYAGQAVGPLREAVEAAPEDPDLRLQLGAALIAAGRPEEAVSHLHEGLKLRPADPRLHHHLGLARSAAGRDTEALVSLRRAVELHPEYAEAQLDLGQVLRRLGRHEEAGKPLEAAVRLHPASAPARLARARLLAHLGRCPEAVEGLERGLRLLPEERPLSVLMAQLLAGCPPPTRDAPRALRLAEEAFAGEATAEHAAVVALARGAGGDWAEAQAWQRRAIGLLPEERRAGREEWQGRLAAYRERRLPQPEW